MTDKDTESKHQEDHLAARAEVIRQYGDLWRQAIAKSGIAHTATTDALLQLCAACYLDGVDKGSTLGSTPGIAMFVEAQSIRDRAIFTLAQDPALSQEGAYEQARQAIQIENEYRQKAE
jgi:hypothetical protein